MGTMQPILLDRDYFRPMATILPINTDRMRLEERYRQTYDDYTRHLARRSTLATEIRSVTREMAGGEDAELSARLSMLTAQRSVWPDILIEFAAAYAQSLADWAGYAYRTFQQIGNEAVDRIDAIQPKIGPATQAITTTHHDSDAHAEAKAKLQTLSAEVAPHEERRRLAQSGMNYVQIAANNAFGACPRCQIGSQHIQTFVDRHRGYTPQEAA